MTVQVDPEIFDALNVPSTVIVIGKGHSGTRLISEILKINGIYMGEPLNVSTDLVPWQPLYACCREYAKQVEHAGGLHWRWPEPDITDTISKLMREYLKCFDGKTGEVGWKLPESILVYPVLLKLFNRAKFIWWVRHPLDSIAKYATHMTGRHHGTHTLSDFNIPGPSGLDPAASYLYQHRIVTSQPKLPPSQFLRLRLEDMVLDEHGARGQLSQFLSREIKMPGVRREAAYRCGKTTPIEPDYLIPIARELGYA